MTGPPALGDGGRVKLPLFTSLRGYDTGWLRGDVVAGLTVWAVLVPEALAYASIAGVSPVVGLYAAPGALLLYAAFGSSRHLVVGPMSATAALSAAAVADVAMPNSAGFVAHTAALAITTGLIALVAGLLRLGFLASFISEPVLKGFIIGLALTIVAGQLPDLFGVEGGGGNFFEKLRHLLSNLDQTSVTTLAVGLASLALVLGLRRFAPAVPGSLVAVLVGIAAVWLLDLDAHGVEIVGQINSGLPALGTPDVAAADYLALALAPAAAGVMLVGFAEGLGAAKTYAARHHLRGGRQPGAGRPRRRQPRGGPVQRHGGERQPLQDGRERLRRGPLPGVGAGRGRPHHPDPAVPHRPVREPAPGDPGRGGDRRRHRAGRLPGHGRPLPDRHPRAARHLRHRRPPWGPERVRTGAPGPARPRGRG
jgi:hypothetical protein